VWREKKCEAFSKKDKKKDNRSTVLFVGQKKGDKASMEITGKGFRMKSKPG